jgi:uncharacterized protein YfcZ (UPF0381/DUF406 family)
MVIRKIIEEADATARLARLTREREELEAQLAASTQAPSIIELHPAALKSYLADIDTLAAT